MTSSLLFSLLCLWSSLTVEVSGQRGLRGLPLPHSYNPHHQHHRIPAPAYGVRRDDRKLVNGFTLNNEYRNSRHFQSHNLQSNLYSKNVKGRPHIRGTRKIETAPLQLDKQFLKAKSDTQNTKKNFKAALEHKYKAARVDKDDNIAIESQVIETRVKPNEIKLPQQKTYSASKPKFIIKQAGPSQQFGWVGPGRFAPLNIPNIFKAAGLNTHWDPGLNSVFPVGLKYPAPPSSHPAHTHQDNVYTTTTKSTTTTTYRPTTVTTTPPPVTYPIPVYQPAHSTAGPAYRPAGSPAQHNEIDTLYYPPALQTTRTSSPVPTTTTKSYRPVTTTPSSRYTYKITNPTTIYKPVTTTPSSRYTYKITNPTTVYKPVTTTPSSRYTYKTYKTTTVRPPPAFNYQSTPQTYFSASTRNPSAYSSPSFFGSPSPVYSSPAPFYGSPSTPYYGYGSPQPSLAPVHHQPSSVRPFTAFTAFSRTTTKPPPSSDSAPIIGIIETEDKNKSEQSKDGEVFYIFYENEDLPQVRSDSLLDFINRCFNFRKP